MLLDCKYTKYIILPDCSFKGSSGRPSKFTLDLRYSDTESMQSKSLAQPLYKAVHKKPR